MHIILHPLFAVGLLWLISKETSVKFKPTKHIGWLFAGVLWALVAFVVYRIDQNINTNFFLHAVGGGVATTMTFFYLKAHTTWRFVRLVELILLFALVSCFGVLNELFEYALELMNVMISSWDTHDTWRDLTANNTGAFVAWIIVKLFKLEQKSS